MRRPQVFLAVGLLAALLVAGIGSFYASSHPDGLEFVAEETGFLDSAEDSTAASGPMADYQTRGIDDPRLSGGVAGVAGALVVLGLGGALFWVIRRRDGAEDASRVDEASTSADPTSRA